MSKIKNIEDYRTVLEELKKQTLSFRKTSNAALNTLKSCETGVKDKHWEQRQREKEEEDFRKSKESYKFELHEKNFFLDNIIDMGQLKDFELTEEDKNVKGEYELRHFLHDKVPDFITNARAILKKAKSDIEDLLPATEEYSPNKKRKRNHFKYRRRRYNCDSDDDSDY